MLNRISLINTINNSCNIFFTGSTFILNNTNLGKFKISGNNTSKARNNYKNESEEINVIKWFEDFWFYLEINFQKHNTFISLSVFQGKANDPIKHQLFRAEWDDYNNSEEKHPQPHWHITANQVIEKTFKELAESTENADTFIGLLEEEKSKIIDVNKIHFAMNGNWINNETHVHLLNNEDKIVRWFQGLLSHIKEQLEYLI